jgi:molybdate transport system substrate-binding protein
MRQGPGRVVRAVRSLSSAGVGVVLAAVVLGLSACGSPPDAGRAATDPAAGGVDGSITVFAAASLREPFTELAEQFEAAHGGAGVTLTFAGSADLVTQITEGAPADVLASADHRTMDRVGSEGLLAADAVDFATNTLQLAVPPDNPAGIASLADAARDGVRTVICAEQVPCGAATRRVAEAAGVELRPVSEETSVTDVLGKVTSGEADAGLVYVTDVLAAGDAVLGIALPQAASAATTYPIATLSTSEEQETARAFVEFVTGGRGRAVLGAAGFGAP